MGGISHIVRRRRSAARFAATGLLMIVLTAPAAANASPLLPAPVEHDPADTPVEKRQGLPAILSEENAERYQNIFSLQERGRWRAADREIKRLDDKLLLGHVFAQRLLHPTHFRSRYRELSGWLRKYADHPQAKRIYELAKKRRPRSAAYPRRPSARLFPVYDEAHPSRSSYRSPRRRARRFMWQIGRYVKRNRFTHAERTVESKRARRYLNRVELDISRARIGEGWLYFGNADKAYEFAAPAARHSGKRFPLAHWFAGLAAFQIGLNEEAADHFESMAQSPRLNSWKKSAAAFWAARANMRSRRPERVHRWLHAAAKHPHTFYGLLAARVLGEEISFEWSLPELTSERVAAMMKQRSGRRALALIQVGRDRFAERELRHVSISRDPSLAMAMLAIAEEARLPALALRAAGHVGDMDGSPPYGALYPVPNWEPAEGFKIDRAVVFAFMRQESGFNTRAKSHAGARGLMQLMPGTAGYMARKRFRGRRRNQLYNPELNISLGQKYLNYLMAHDTVQGNLLMLAAAYNGGPGNLRKWRRRAKRSRYLDPLMFIESIPSDETRNFVERVLANLWIYRARLGQPSPSLDLLATGQRPIYESLDNKTGQLAHNVWNRR